MDATLALDLIRETCFLILKISAPVLLVSLFVGLIISLLQALTQIQEMTVSFVPKLIAVLFTLVLSFPFMLGELTKFTHILLDKVTILKS